jgi:Rv2525c-like, glycoside hydrolase-like domain
LVEYLLPKQKVAGSSPVSRSIVLAPGRLISLLLLFLLSALGDGQTSFRGFDRNDYPGDAALPALKKTFSYTSYWLNTPPGAKSNSWEGKRQLLQDTGFGFLVLFNGRMYAELKSLPDASRAGAEDGKTAARSAQAQGFPSGTIVFLDQEEGGRLLDLQKSYIYAFVDAINQSGFKPGVYCSGIPLMQPNGESINTATDLQNTAGERRIAYWIANDACPPSPGCTTEGVLSPSESGIAFADVWQYAQSPRRHFSDGCSATYPADKNCYAPATHIHVDLNIANSPDPSHGRR